MEPEFTYILQAWSPTERKDITVYVDGMPVYITTLKVNFEYIKSITPAGHSWLKVNDNRD